MSDVVVTETQGDESAAIESSNERPVGEVLRQAREARSLKVEDIAQTLKLGFRQVEALESGDWNGLPGQTFIRGFVRNYARLVGVDPLPLMAQLDRVLAQPGDNLAIRGGAPASMPTAGRRVSHRDRNFILGGLGLVVVAILAYYLFASDLTALRGSLQSIVDSFARKDEAAELQAPKQAASEPVLPPGATQQQVMYPQALAPAEGASVSTAPVAGESAVPTQQVAAGAQAAALAPQLQFRADKESWVEVRDRENKVVFSQRLLAGTEQAVSGQGPLSLTIGYAPGVRLYWRGQAVDLNPHMRGDVARLVLE